MAWRHRPFWRSRSPDLTLGLLTRRAQRVILANERQRRGRQWDNQIMRRGRRRRGAGRAVQTSSPEWGAGTAGLASQARAAFDTGAP